MLVCHYENMFDTKVIHTKEEKCPDLKNWKFITSENYLDDNGDIIWNSNETTESR